MILPWSSELDRTYLGQSQTLHHRSGQGCLMLGQCYSSVETPWASSSLLWTCCNTLLDETTLFGHRMNSDSLCLFDFKLTCLRHGFRWSFFWFGMEFPEKLLADCTKHIPSCELWHVHSELNFKPVIHRNRILGQVQCS